jgi:transcriptional regulator with XRE-family HTH domain
MESIKEVVQKNCKRLLAKPVNLNELSRSMQIHPSTISRWKSGEHAPELDKIDRLAELLNIDASEFFRTEKDLPRSEPVSKSLMKMMAIPDEVYDLAISVPKGHKAWETVVDALRLAIPKGSGKKVNGS